MSSNHKYKLFAILLAGLSQPAWSAENAWPQLDSTSDGSICSEALKIADSAYRSNNFYLYELPIIPQDVNSTLVLEPSTQYGADLSGGDGLVVDAAVFKKIPKNNQDGNFPRSIYWQNKASHGLRYVMDENAFGWRGDQYTLFAIKEDITPDEFTELYNRNTQEADRASLIGQGWRPPLMLQEKDTKNVWAIDVGAPYRFLSDWAIYSVGADGAKQRCAIWFYPRAKTATSLLPKPVRELATLLNGTSGGGQNEGTLQPTARIHKKVMHTWANVAVRPWAALKSDPYNSREQVDSELKKWSHKAKDFRKLYQAIYAQYPKAERALANYYKTQFNKNTDEANVMAKQALDIAFRTYFILPKQR